MQKLDVNKTADAWSSLAGTVFVPHGEEDYRRLVALLDGLIDEVGGDDIMRGFYEIEEEDEADGETSGKP
jgi:hypothetical protein